MLVGTISLAECFLGSRVLLDNLFYDFLQKNDLQKLSPVAILTLIFLGVLILIRNSDRFFNLYVVNIIAVLIFSIGLIGYASSLFGLTEIVESRTFIDIADAVWLAFIFLPAGIICRNLTDNDMRLGPEQQLLIGVTFITVMIVFIAANSGARIKNIQDINRMIKSSIQFKESLRVVQGHILDLQSGVRGYVISNDKRFLEDPEKAIRSLSGALSHLDSLLVFSPSQRQSFTHLSKLVESRIRQARIIISKRRSAGPDMKLKDIDIMTGSSLTDSIRVVINEMIKSENKLLEVRNIVEVERAKKARSVIFANLIIQFLMMILIFRMIVSYLRERRSSLEEIRKINESLELRIKERTMLLEESENKYKYLFENNPLPMLIFDKRTHSVIEVNEAAEKLYGYTQQEFCSMIINDLRLPEDASDLIGHLENKTGDYPRKSIVKHKKKERRSNLC